jgi:DNA-binding CsgD family transcriptional regulator
MKCDPDEDASERQVAAFEFGSALLAMTASYGVEALAIGGLPHGDNAFPIREQLSTVVESRLLPVCSKELTHFFLKSKLGKEVRHVICTTAAHRDEEIARAGKGVAVIICSDDRDPKRKGVIFFGSEIREDESTGQHLAMIADYAFTRMTTILGLSPIQPLTGRQIEVLSWAAEGKTDQEIAMILGLSDHTIDKYMRQIREALCAVNRTAAIVIAMRRGLIA